MLNYKIVQKQIGDKIVEFIEACNEHWYKPQGQEEYFKSVTMVLDIISKGYFFNEWLKNNGRNADYITRQAMESGSKLHNVFERSIRGDLISFGSTFMGSDMFTFEEWEKYNQWYDWFEYINGATLAVEQVLYHPDLKVAGLADWIGIINGEVWLLDWKTGNAIYETSKLQVSAYSAMWNLLVDHGILSYPKIERAGIVHVGADIRTKNGMNSIGVKVEEANINEEFINFKHALALFDRFNPNIQPKLKQYPLERRLTKGLLLLPTEVNK